MQKNTPFKINVDKKLKWVASAGEHVLGLKTLERYYNKRRHNMGCREFLRYTLETLQVDYRISSGNIDSVPDKGPLIVVANHPFGAMDGVVLADLLLKKRSDVRILANQFLRRIDELSELFIGVDVLAENKKQSNMTGLRNALSHLNSGGVLLVFPAGEVSTLDLQRKQITDKSWNRMIGMMARKTGAQCVPVFIEGTNSSLFHAVGLAHERLRTILLAREMLNKRNMTIQLHIGDAISSNEYKHLDSDAAITHYFRLNTYLLTARTKEKETETANAIGALDKIAVAPQQDIDRIMKNVMELPKNRLMFSTDQFDVYCAPASELLYVLPEIGRLREITFRSVGEGTGMSCDLDAYDRYYLHLFVWDRNAKAIAGAYRLGLVDKIMSHRGVKALYSRSLFNYGTKFVSSLDNAIEMGRSFVCMEYQRSLNVLMLLWKGIATYVAKNPHYTTLFGPVSISNDYTELSRSLMTSYLQLHFYDEKLARLIKPTKMLKQPPEIFWTRNMLVELEDEQLLSRLVQRMEGDKGLPVLIRQYLNLNGKLVCFNVDKDFNDALDGMIIVDLRNVTERVLARYMGKDAAVAYLQRHNRFAQAA